MGVVVCFECNTENNFDSFVGRRDECEKCGADLHVCKNCENYDPKYNNSCREVNDEIVTNKERSNFCDHFTPSGKPGDAKDNKADLLAAAEALFKKK